MKDFAKGGRDDSGLFRTSGRDRDGQVWADLSEDGGDHGFDRNADYVSSIRRKVCTVTWGC